MNTLGRKLRLTTFGESHGPAIGGVLDGFPSNIRIDMEYVAREMMRRRPGQSAITTGRTEKDEVEFISGLLEGVSTGTPIAFIIRNTDCRPTDYDDLKDLFRPSHADYAWQAKYGIRDWRGGGRSSARVTAPICVAGALARLALKDRLPDLDIYAYTSQVGNIAVDSEHEAEFCRDLSEANSVRCPDQAKAAEMEAFIRQMKKEGDSTGGIITCIVRGCPVGLGEPVFGKLQSQLGAAMLGINAVKGFDYGEGFACASMRGSECNDPFAMKNGAVCTTSNHSGGIQGGISNGQPIRFRVAFKPTPTIGKEQQAVNAHGDEIIFKASGRHDPCVVPRAVPIVESLTALVILDNILQ